MPTNRLHGLFPKVNDEKDDVAMVVRTEQEAMFVACQMESTAVQLYQRALQLMEQLGRREEALYTHLQQMLSDEQEHLRRFRSFYHGVDSSDEQQLMLSAIAEGILFEGGLMGAARQGLLKDPEGLFDLAMRAEQTSACKYREFAAAAESEEARQALLSIASEEDGHLLALQGAAVQS